MIHKTLKIIFLLSLISCSNVRESKKPEWIVLDIKDKNCEVSFPFDSYKVSKEEYYTEIIGKVYSYEVDLNTQKLDDKNLGYKIAIYDCPKVNSYDFSEETIDKLLHGVAEKILIEFNASRLSEKRINLNGYPGKEMYYYLRYQGIYITTRVYIVNGRQYILTVFTDKNHVLNSAIIQFFDSFKIKNCIE